MRTETVQIKVYKFEELDDDVQEKVLCTSAEIDYEWWDYEGILDLTQKEMDDRGITNEEYRDLFFSYEIGAFDIDRRQFLQFSQIDINDDDLFRRFLKIPKDLWEYCNWGFDYSPGRYSNTHFAIEADPYEEIAPNQEIIIERAEEIMNDKIHDAWGDLRNQYEYITSREYIEETIRANEYEFTADGKIY